MYFLFIKLIDIGYKEDVILALQSIGATRASYFESTNLEHALNDEVRLFTGFFGRDKHEGEQAVVTALVEDQDLIEEFINNLRSAGIDIDGEDILRTISWPVSMVFDRETGITKFDA